MSPEHKLKYAILALQNEWDSIIKLPDNLTEEEIEDRWDEAECLQDATNEIRCSGTPTGLEAPYSRHYESTAVAVCCPNGEWVGFTYWYGGGKWGEPEGIDWINNAYDISCSEEQKMVTVRTFSKVNGDKE